METPVVPSNNAPSPPPPPPRVKLVLLRDLPRLFALSPLEEPLALHHKERLLSTPAHPSVHQPAPSPTAAPVTAPAPMHPLLPRPATRPSKALSSWPHPTSPHASSPPRWCRSARSPRPAAPCRAWPSPSPTVLLTVLHCPTVLPSPGPWLLCSYCTNRWDQEGATPHHRHITPGCWGPLIWVQQQHFHCQGDPSVKWGWAVFRVGCDESLSTFFKLYILNVLKGVCIQLYSVSI